MTDEGKLDRVIAHLRAQVAELRRLERGTAPRRRRSPSESA